MTELILIKNYIRLVHTVRNSVSRSVDDLGQGSFTHCLGCNNWRSDSRVGNWRSHAGIGNWRSHGRVGDWRGNGSVVWVAKDAGVSKGAWDNSRSENGTLLSSGSSKSLLMSNGMGSTSLSDLGGFLNWGWTGEGGNLMSCWSYWTNWKGVGSNLEAPMAGSIFNSHFLSFGVNVSVASANVSGGITDSGMSLSSVGVSVGSLTEFILSMILGLGDGWNSV
jgi:hypothetical protein